MDKRQDPGDFARHFEAYTRLMPDDELYGLEPTPKPPRLPGVVVVRPDVDAILDSLCADILIHAYNCVRTFGDFHLALSGGSTPLPLYQRLMIDPRYRDLPWARTHLWIVDERRVPFDDDRSNFKAIGEILVDHSGIPREQVHPIHAMRDDADAAYQSELREVLGWREPGHDRLDCVILGMGADAHTASLFPHSPALLESLRWSGPDLASAGAMRGAKGSAGGEMMPLVRMNTGPKVTPPERVTMMLPLINASRFIGVLVTGKSKRATLAKVAEAATHAPATAPEGMRVTDLPILGIKPIGARAVDSDGKPASGDGGAGTLRWYMDFDACQEPTPDGTLAIG